MNLSNNFKLSEFTKSRDALKYKIDNTPNEKEIESLKYLCENILEPIRKHFGVPIIISSGFRSKELNIKTGGSKNSHHVRGMAVDIDQDGTSITNKEVFQFIKNNLKFTQLIWEYGNDNNPAWIHVSLDPDDIRMQVLKIK